MTMNCHFFVCKIFYQTKQQQTLFILEIKAKRLSQSTSDSKILEFYLPPIETFMNIPSDMRTEHLFKHIKTGDIVISQMDYMSDSGIHMRMICFDDHKQKDLRNVKLNLVCPLLSAFKVIKLDSSSTCIDKSDMNPTPTISSMRAHLETVYQSGDYLRCIVVCVDSANDSCEVRILDEVSFADLPSHYHNIVDYEKGPYSYDSHLRYERKFNNPACTGLLIKKLGVDLKSNFSLMKGLFDFSIKDGEMATDLLKQQNRKLALQSVQKGIEHFKAERTMEALQCYNKALSIDNENVEAYVARGALSANEGDFEKAINDLEAALSYDRNHSNAKIYLKEVFIANAVKLEKSYRFEEALFFLKKSLNIDPENQLILSKLKNVERIIEEIEEEKLKDSYGPSLPSKSKKNKKSKSKSNKHRSKTPPEIDIRSPVNSSSKKSRIDTELKRSCSSDQGDRKSNVSNTHSRADSSHKEKLKKAETTDDDEDLEDFFNSLKKNKASGNKK